MSDTIYFITVLGIAAIVIFGIASLMDRRHKEKLPNTQLSLGPVGKLLLWGSRGILGLAILTLVSSFALNEIAYARFSWNFLIAYIFLGFLFQIVRKKGV